MRSVHEKLLVWLLRLFGVVTMLAIFAVFLPVEWMARTHAWLGLGEYPDVPLTDYLTRSLSAMYAIHAGMLLVVATDVRRYRAIVVYFGWLLIGCGVLFVGIDLHAGMPHWWTWAEGPPVFVSGIAVLYLVGKIPRD